MNAFFDDIEAQFARVAGSGGDVCALYRRLLLASVLRYDSLVKECKALRAEVARCRERERAHQLYGREVSERAVGRLARERTSHSSDAEGRPRQQKRKTSHSRKPQGTRHSDPLADKGLRSGNAPAIAKGSRRMEPRRAVYDEEEGDDRDRHDAARERLPPFRCHHSERRGREGTEAVAAAAANAIPSPTKRHGAGGSADAAGGDVQLVSELLALMRQRAKKDSGVVSKLLETEEKRREKRRTHAERGVDNDEMAYEAAEETSDNVSEPERRTTGGSSHRSDREVGERGRTAAERGHEAPLSREDLFRGIGLFPGTAGAREQGPLPPHAHREDDERLSEDASSFGVDGGEGCDESEGGIEADSCSSVDLDQHRLELELLGGVDTL